MNTESLSQLLRQLDHRGYKAYQDLESDSYEYPDFTLIVDRVQGDPFAAPSHFRVKMSQSVAEFPSELYNSCSREIALRDYLTRQFDGHARQLSRRRGIGNSGLITIAEVGQEVLERTSALMTHEFVEIRFFVGLPADGRRISGQQAAEMLLEDIPTLIEHTLKYRHLTRKEIQRHIETVEDADYLRQHLPQMGLVAFIADGAILPRVSGVDQRPLQNQVVAFKSPTSLRVTAHCPNRGEITGMGIPDGVTLIVGGGYHGKSTLLQSIELGIYNHIPGDGREFVVTHPSAVKIRAEDGRSIAGVDISPLINCLPQGRSTTQFFTTNASGSTSQAANIMEALEVGTQMLLVDEDTSATNFMIRDRRMQALIAQEKEPITPFIDKVRQLFTDYGVSTILVMGGSGDYFDVADTVIALENFQPFDVTVRAKAIALEYATGRIPSGGHQFGQITPRVPLPESIDPSRGFRQVSLKVRNVDSVLFGTQEIDCEAVEQIVEVGQLRAIGKAMVYAQQRYIDGKRTLAEILELVMVDVATGGLDVLTNFPQGDLAIFRQQELSATINRLRTLAVA